MPQRKEHRGCCVLRCVPESPGERRAAAAAAAGYVTNPARLTLAPLGCREREAKRAERAALEGQLEGRLRQMHTWDTQRTTKQRAVEEYVQLVRQRLVVRLFPLLRLSSWVRGRSRRGMVAPGSGFQAGGREAGLVRRRLIFFSSDAASQDGCAGAGEHRCCHACSIQASPSVPSASPAGQGGAAAARERSPGEPAAAAGGWGGQAQGACPAVLALPACSVSGQQGGGEARPRLHRLPCSGHADPHPHSRVPAHLPAFPWCLQDLQQTFRDHQDQKAEQNDTKRQVCSCVG